jgi:hypothetical protein
LTSLPGRDFGAATGFCDLYSFLSQIRPYFDSELSGFTPAPSRGGKERYLPRKIFRNGGTIFRERGTPLVKGG